SLDPRRALAAKNRLAVDFSLDATGADVVDRRERTVSQTFIVPPRDGVWSDYQIVMWQQQTQAAYTALKRLGVTGAAVLSDRRPEPSSRVINQIDAVLDADLRWYLENTATDFYSAYHRWSPDHPVNWRFLEAKKRYAANPQDKSAFERE